MSDYRINEEIRARDNCGDMAESFHCNDYVCFRLRPGPTGPTKAEKSAQPLSKKP